jgi:hypothetical protein
VKKGLFCEYMTGWLHICSCADQSNLRFRIADCGVDDVMSSEDRTCVNSKFTEERSQLLCEASTPQSEIRNRKFAGRSTVAQS